MGKKKRRRAPVSGPIALTENGLPTEFEARLHRIVPTRLIDQVIASLGEREVVGVRVNPLVADPDSVRAWFRDNGVGFRPLLWQPTGFVTDRKHREMVTRSSLAGDGSIYIQSPSSQLAVSVLNPQPGEIVLDLAAAPGGKTTHIAALMQNCGLLSAVEPVRDRFFRLQSNLRRMGVTICRTYMTDGRSVGRKTGPRFDRVLLDAPCSSESRMNRADPESMRIWSLRKIQECSRKQCGLIESAFRAIRPGGTLLYCTCSMAPEENERVVQSLLNAHPDTARLLPIPPDYSNDGEILSTPGLPEFDGEKFDSSIQLTARILPSQTMEAFFLALITKVGQDHHQSQSSGHRVR